MNLVIKSNFWEDVKENIYGIVRKNQYANRDGIPSTKICRACCTLNVRNKEPKMLRPFYYCVRDRFMFKNFWGDIERFNISGVLDARYCQSKKIKENFDLGRAMANSRLFCIDGIMFYNPPQSYHLYVCVDKDNKVIGLEEEVIS